MNFSILLILSGVVLILLILLFLKYFALSFIQEVTEESESSEDFSASFINISTSINNIFSGLLSIFSRLCICVFKFKTGKLEIDSSCVGRLNIWVIPENVANPAFTPATSGVNYEADGYQIGGQIFKIDGSTCVKIKCTATGHTVHTCVNLIALGLGKGPPTRVPRGTFGNQPPAGTPASPVV